MLEVVLNVITVALMVVFLGLAIRYRHQILDSNDPETIDTYINQISESENAMQLLGNSFLNAIYALSSAEELHEAREAVSEGLKPLIGDAVAAVMSEVVAELPLPNKDQLQQAENVSKEVMQDLQQEIIKADIPGPIGKVLSNFAKNRFPDLDPDVASLVWQYISKNVDMTSLTNLGAGNNPKTAVSSTPSTEKANW